MWVPHTIPEILAVFLDNKRKKDWIPRLWINWAEDDPKILGKRIEYAEVLVPWPYYNRDILVRIDTQVSQNTNNVKLFAYSVQNDRIIKKSNVRAIVHPSDLNLSYNDKTKETLLETISFTDPGGYIPKWLVNFFQKDEAKILSLRLRSQLSLNLYNEKELSHIRSGLVRILKSNSKK